MTNPVLCQGKLGSVLLWLDGPSKPGYPMLLAGSRVDALLKIALRLYATLLT